MSIRSISKQTGICRKTIRDYLGRIQSLGINLEKASELSDEELSVLIFFNPSETRRDEASERFNYIQDRMDYYRQELQKLGVTKNLLWHENRKDNPQGYGHSQFGWYTLIPAKKL